MLQGMATHPMIWLRTVGVGVSGRACTSRLGRVSRMVLEWVAQLADADLHRFAGAVKELGTDFSFAPLEGEAMDAFRMFLQ